MDSFDSFCCLLGKAVLMGSAFLVLVTLGIMATTWFLGKFFGKDKLEESEKLHARLIEVLVANEKFMKPDDPKS